MQENKLYSSLTYAGTLPFIASALLPFFGITDIPNVGSVESIARVYGLAIASFVAGSHWGTYLYNHDASPNNLFITSNIVVLSAWFAFMLTGSAITFFVLILSFAYLLFVDWALHKAGLTTPYYFRMRFIATVVVCTSLVGSIVGL